jgi:signal transduction histidine kinase/ligand-binding sensor domain-containing protein
MAARRRDSFLIAIALVSSVLPNFLPSARAVTSSLDVSQYIHSQWTPEGGFFRGNLREITQTTDGYLWIATGFGLLRFDGVRFVDWHPPNGDPLLGSPLSSVLGTRNGSLWVGGRGLLQIKAGIVTRYPELDQIDVQRIVETKDGAVWAGGADRGSSGKSLCRIQNSKAQCFGDGEFLGNWVRSLYEDRGGRLWAGSAKGLWRIEPGPPQHYSYLNDKFASVDGIIHDISENSDGLLILAYDTEMRFLGQDDQIYNYPLRVEGKQVSAAGFLRDRDGGLWIATSGQGLVHVHDNRVDTFTKPDGLSSTTVHAFFQDREGNIWMASNGSLDKFRKPAITKITEKQGLSNNAVFSVLSTRDGGLWVGTFNGLNKFDGNAIVTLDEKQGLPSSDVVSLFENSKGRFLVTTNTPDGMVWLDGSRATRITGTGGGGNVFAIAEDAQGDLWMSNRESGLMHLRSDGSLIEKTPWKTLGAGAYALAYDPGRQGLWLTGGRGQLTFYKDGRIAERYGSADGFGNGMLRDVQVDKDGAVWVGTSVGLARLMHGKVAVLSHLNGLPCDVVHWMRHDDEQTVWLYTECGLVRVSAQDLAAWTAQPDRKVAVLDFFDAKDGVENMSDVAYYVPLVTKTNEGRLLFGMSSGLGVIDPQHLFHNLLPPPVHVEEIAADGRTFSVAGQVLLPQRIRNLRISYTALSFVVPEKVRFRYQLEGFDKEWREATSIREVNYTNLSPGRYRFHVIACNNDGLWNMQGDWLSFVIPPAFYQTTWFLCVMIGLFLATVWTIFRIRLRTAAAALESQLGERLMERDRIARDLHDTLLQGFQALLLRLHTAMNTIAPDAPAHQIMENALDRADEVLLEGRNRVKDLRSHETGKGNLVEPLETLIEELRELGGPDLRLTVVGEPRTLKFFVADEAYLIAREALGNAMRHSLGSEVLCELHYEENELLLISQDNGVGISSETLASGGKSGHWGLIGMRERARKIDATLTIDSRPSGTRIELRVPGRSAFASYDTSLLQKFLSAVIPFRRYRNFWGR